jgi:hypothetical protein
MTPSDARRLREDVRAAMGDLAQVLNGFVEVAAFGGVPHCGREVHCRGVGRPWTRPSLSNQRSITLGPPSSDEDTMGISHRMVTTGAA